MTPLHDELRVLAEEVTRKIGRIHPSNRQSVIPVTIKVSRSYAEWAALIAALEAQAWRDIATAPRDDVILVHFSDGTIDTAMWNNGIWAAVRRSIDASATHWLPLPSPPEGETE